MGTSSDAKSGAKPRHTLDNEETPEKIGRRSTISVAVGASCIENAQNLELATLLAGQIARACAIYNIDEIVVLDDVPRSNSGTVSAAAVLFARILQFMETPQYLKKALIPMHPSLRFAGILPPLDAPHHLRATEWSVYREGVVQDLDIKEGRSFVDVGLEKVAFLNEVLRHGARVTLQMGEKAEVDTIDGIEVYKALLASPREPRERYGMYWGYFTRIAPTLESLYNEGPYDGGYDLTIGTSERGERNPARKLHFPEFKHALIVFGGPQGLEACLEVDPWRDRYAEPKELFQRYLNTCHNQGSRTIRTEEAVLISLAFMQPALESA